MHKDGDMIKFVNRLEFAYNEFHPYRNNGVRRKGLLLYIW